METIKKECKVVMLPTKEKTNVIEVILTLSQVKTLEYISQKELHDENDVRPFTEMKYEHQHLYILSDEEIEEKDVFIFTYRNIFVKNFYFNEDKSKIYIHKNYSPFYGWADIKDCKKIIASTDSSLNLPKPSQAFIKKYCELNGEIDKVMVEYYQQYYHSINDEDNGTNSWTKISKEEFEIKSSKRDYFDEFDFKEWLKTNSKNEISISSVKNNWNREEIEELINKSFNEGFLFGYRNGLKEDLVHKETIKTKIKNWIKENL